MTPTMIVAVSAIAIAASASAQDLPRLEAGPVARLDRVSFEGRTAGSTVAAGLGASVRLWRGIGVEAEVTQASGDITRSYEGWFVSYIEDMNATRAEIEAMAPTARRTIDHTPGLGWSGAMAVRRRAARRVTMAARVGVSARRYQQTSSFVVLTIPQGIDPARVARDFQEETAVRIRAGLLFGADAAIELTKHLAIVPDVRVIYGGPAQVGNNYDEFGFGTRAVWRF
jgi:hypothetical protein